MKHVNAIFAFDCIFSIDIFPADLICWARIQWAENGVIFFAWGGWALRNDPIKLGISFLCKGKKHALFENMAFVARSSEWGGGGAGCKVSVCVRVHMGVCQLRVCAVRVVHRTCPMYDAQLKHDMMEEGRQ